MFYSRIVRTEGIFALEEFFDAAKEAGIYLWARPGPYINSEVSGGGLPGWLQRNKAQLRSTDPAFLNATKNYISHIGKIISKAEITKGGPVILFQPENEYSLFSGFRGLEEISSYLDKESWIGCKKSTVNLVSHCPCTVTTCSLLETSDQDRA